MIIKLSQDRKVMGVKHERNSFGLPIFTTCPDKIELQSAYANCKLCFGPYNKNNINMILGYLTEQKIEFHINKNYGKKIGIHFPRNKVKGHK